MESYEYRCLFENAKKQKDKTTNLIKINADLSKMNKDKFKRKKYH